MAMEENKDTNKNINKNINKEKIQNKEDIFTGLKAGNIAYSYRRHEVLNCISFELPKGKAAALLGANGSGKSTLLSILSGIRRSGHPSDGSIPFYSYGDGNQTSDLFRDKKSCSRIISYVPQEDPLMPELSVKDNLLLWYSGSRKNFQSALLSPAIAALDISSFMDRPVKALSGGMRKRVSLAAALINEPEVLLLDEPASALDLSFKAELRKYLSSLRDSGTTLLISTHDEEDLDICDIAFLLKDGILTSISTALRGEELLKLIK